MFIGTTFFPVNIAFWISMDSNKFCSAPQLLTTFTGRAGHFLLFWGAGRASLEGAMLKVLSHMRIHTFKKGINQTFPNWLQLLHVEFKMKPSHKKWNHWHSGLCWFVPLCCCSNFLVCRHQPSRSVSSDLYGSWPCRQWAWTDCSGNKIAEISYLVVVFRMWAWGQSPKLNPGHFEEQRENRIVIALHNVLLFVQ